MEYAGGTTSAQLRASVERVLLQAPGIGASSRLVVGVSGGPDSLALLHLLANSFFSRPTLLVAHLNHQMRDSAAAEAEQVAGICRAWGMECRTGILDVKRMARAQHLSLEDAARQARYRFLADVARESGARFVAVGHHADDQTETVLMHFLRGAGLAGLRGMQPVANMPNERDLLLIRPLLYVDRGLIEAYCSEQKLEPLLDASNMDSTFFRNRLRHELLPVLESYNPQIRKGLQSSAEVLSADYALLESLQQAAWDHILHAAGPGWRRLDLAGWQALPLSIRRMTLRHAVGQLRRSLRDVSFISIENARNVLESGVVGKRAALPGDITLTVGYDDWTVAVPEAVLPAGDSPQIDEERDLPVPGQVSLANGWFIEAELLAQVAPEMVFANEDKWTAYLAVETAARLTVRRRREGERFQPLGMAGRSARVKDVMINARIPATRRSQWPLVAEKDHLVWLVGERIDERARVRQSGPVVKLTCRRRSPA